MKMYRLTGIRLNLGYSENSEDEIRGCIGHLRGDFSGDSYSFWTTWFPHQGNRLNTPSFQKELWRVKKVCRDYFLANLDMLREFCEQKLAEKVYGESGYGLMLESGAYTFVLRLNPEADDYQFFMYCYESETLRRYLSGKEHTDDY